MLPQFGQAEALLGAEPDEDQGGVEGDHAQGHDCLDQVVELEGGGQRDEAEHPGEDNILAMHTAEGVIRRDANRIATVSD